MKSSFQVLQRNGGIIAQTISLRQFSLEMQQTWHIYYLGLKIQQTRIKIYFLI
jgi:hypothetical protein